jgi:AhpD family alkylhydroperoxidase
MKTFTTILGACAVLLTAAACKEPAAKEASAKVSEPTRATGKLDPATGKLDPATAADIEKTLGAIPTLFTLLPADGAASGWQAFKGLALTETAMSFKAKELTGLAVSAQIPCRYCVYFHTEAARLMGAKQQEIDEALAMAALTRQWSTVLNGMQIDEEEFSAQLRDVFAHVKKGAPAGAEIAVVDADTAYADMRRTLGLVPTFLAKYPRSAIPGAWKEFKQIQLSDKTALAVKDKELIGLAVSAQIPCRYCVHYHTEVARFAGASDAEIADAVAVAASIRHWSTLLNGAQVDEATFRKETDRALAHLARQAAAK